MMRSPALLALFAFSLLSACVSGKLQPVAEAPPPVESKAFEAELAKVSKATWAKGNSVNTLVNGGQFFPAMLAAIRTAKQTVNFETYVCVDSPQVEMFSDAFRERARAGVKVHLILDAYGCNTYGKKHLEAMRRDGVEIRHYNRFKLWRPFHYNHRTHRRILVVDGQVGFIGGAGIAYAWDGNAEDPLRWRDTQYELRGPVVRQLQDLFNENWRELTGSRLEGSGYYPELKAEGRAAAQSVAGRPDRDEETIGGSYLLAIRAARESILISHSYFIPCKEITDALVTAARRGVHVELVVPGEHTDMPICLPTSAPALRRMLAAGVQMFEYERCMMHSKLVVIDGHLSIVGSGNIDSRSFFINDENNLQVLDAKFAAEQKAMFERDKEACKPLTADDLKRLPLGRKLLGVAGRLVERQL